MKLDLTPARIAGLLGLTAGAVAFALWKWTGKRGQARPLASSRAGEGGRSVIMLVTSMPSTTIIEGNQASLRNILKAKLKVTVSEIDGVVPENKDTRSALFGCSGKRGVYPQVFIKGKDGDYTFVGDFEEIQSLTDTDSLDPTILAQHPEISTFSSTFAEFM